MPVSGSELSLQRKTAGAKRFPVRRCNRGMFPIRAPYKGPL